MDTMATTGDVAELLGVTMPTVRRTADRLGLSAKRTKGGHRRFSSDQVDSLAAVLGVTPHVEGLARPLVQVLAALARRPLGVRSRRAIARATGLSPTTVSAAVEHLAKRGMVETKIETAAEGRARDVEVTRLRIDRPWLSVAPVVNCTILPRVVPTEEASTDRIPPRFTHLFWNADPTKLSPTHDASFIARRLINGPDPAARAWALRTLPESALRDASRGRGTSASTRALVDNFLVAR